MNKRKRCCQGGAFFQNGGIAYVGNFDRIGFGRADEHSGSV